MLSDFQKMIEGFAGARGVEWQESPVPGMGSILLDGYPLNIVYREESDMLMFNGIVAMPPEDQAERAALFARILTMNNMFSGTFGACLGHDAGEDVVTFQVAWPMAGLTQEAFNNLVENMVGLAGELLHTLSRPIEMVVETSLPRPPVNVIRV